MGLGRDLGSGHGTADVGQEVSEPWAVQGAGSGVQGQQGREPLL